MRIILALIFAAGLHAQARIDLWKQVKNGPVIPACVGTPGNTPGVKNTVCVDASNLLYICTQTTCSLAGHWSAITGGSGSSGLVNVVANAATGTVSNSNLQRAILTNTGASAQVNLTLGTATCTVGQVFTAYLTVAQPVKLIPFAGDQILTLTSAVNHSITSDANVSTFVSLTCLAAGQWSLSGLNGLWTDTN